MKKHVIAVDGPAGAGKSTTARQVAERLGWLYVDSGAMYRAVAVAVLRGAVDPRDETAVCAVAESAAIDLRQSPRGGRVLLDGEDVTEAARGAEATAIVSLVSSYAGVRQRLVAVQRALARTRDVVMDGRDIGTVVFPDADVKIFLVASLAERARRRAAELAGAGGRTGEPAVAEQLERRDAFDASRTHSPLKRAADAVEVDTTGMSIAEQVDRVLAIVAERLGVRA